VRGYSAIGLVNSKSDPNVGGALRAAHCYGAALVAIQGSRCQKQSSDTTKMARHIPLIHAADIFQTVPDGCATVAIEFIREAVPLQDFTHPERALYVFGPEDGSIPVEVVGRCDHVVFVPTTYCMNLAATVNVVLYDRMAKREKRSKSNPNGDHPVEVLDMAAD
jgi:tRNA(Leu) C34 or U34 (ribose-2'-O)-methylase TrmL